VAIYAAGVPLRVAVAEDSLLVREGVRVLLASEPDLAVFR
jgi:hypothetical protein